MLFEGDPEPTPPEGMVTVGRFESPVEAQIAKGMLESFGIECFLVGENANNLFCPRSGCACRCGRRMRRRLASCWNNPRERRTQS